MLSAIIPTRDRESVLEESLRALLAAEPDADSLEVIVVEDGGGGASAVVASLADRRVRVLPNAGRGAAAARNCGARAAAHSILLFLDDDILVSPGSIPRHCAVHGRFPKTLVLGIARLPELLVQRAKQTAFGRYKIRYDYRLESAARGGALGDGIFRAIGVASFNLSVERDDFLLLLGGFDERFPYAGCEDQELSFRARARGLGMVIDEKQLCLHNEGDRFTPLPWLQRQYTGVQGAVLLAHLYPEGKKHPLYRAFSPASREDGIRLIARKALIASFARWPRLLLGAAHALEVGGLPDSILFKLYHLLWAVYTWNGFRTGLRNLRAVGTAWRSK